MENRHILSAKKHIIQNTIQQDQEAVAEQWAKTFCHSSADNLAANMAKIMLACIAKGDFQTRCNLFNNDQLRAPTDALTIADYLSHASRIIIDYADLSEENQKKLLAYFPTNHEKVISRSATHATHKNLAGQVIEDKGFMIGVNGQMPAMVVTPKDFGTNIAMGGEGQKNLIGNTITENGCSGHLYFHLNANDKLLMAGLEQSAPPTVYDLVSNHAHNPHSDTQEGSDQFGQSHSMLGASDTYTAAGSLYFSDPVYQAKLLAEKNCLPPDKYGAMQIKLNDNNIESVFQVFGTLSTLSATQNNNELKNTLMQRPASAVHYPEDEVKTYIGLDFLAYFKRISILLENTLPAELKDLKTLESMLINQLHSFQKCELADPEVTIRNIIAQITALPTVSESYKQAVTRINILTEKQMRADTHYVNLLIQRESDDVIDTANELQEQISQIKLIYTSAVINTDATINSFLKKMNAIENRLTNILNRYKQDILLSSSSTDLSQSLSNSWIGINSNIPLSEIQQDQAALQEIQALLSQLNPPVLCSNESLQALIDANDGLREKYLIAFNQLNAVAEENKLQSEFLHQQDVTIENLEHQLNEQRRAANALQQQIAELQAEQKAIEVAAQNLGPVADEADDEIENEINPEEVAERAKILAPFYIQLEILQRKSAELENRGHHQAASYTRLLVVNLNKMATEYLANEMTLDGFKHHCRQHIEIAKPILEQHRGVKKILSNIAACIAGLGIGYFIAGLINLAVNKKFLFFNETDSGEKAKRIESCINELQAPLPAN